MAGENVARRRNKKKMVLAGFLFVGMLCLCGCESLYEQDILVFWTSWKEDSTFGQVIKNTVEDYEQETGVDVQVIYNGNDEQKKNLVTALNNGEQIDLFDIDLDYLDGQLNSKKTLNKKSLKNLESYAKRDNYEDTAYAGLMEAARRISGGKLRTIPYIPKTMGFFYNKNLFYKAGIQEKPTTWDEFVEDCRLLKAAGITPITTDDAYVNTLIGTHMNRLAGQEYVEKLVKNEDWNDPVMVQTANDYEKLANAGAFSANVGLNVWPEGQKNEFGAGKVAMYFNGTWLKNEISGIDLGFFAYPEVTEGATSSSTGRETNYIGGFGLCVNGASSKSEEAYALIEKLTKGTDDQNMSTDADVIPVDVRNEWPRSLVMCREMLVNTTQSTSYASNVGANKEKNDVLNEGFTKLISGEYDSQEFINSLY